MKIKNDYVDIKIGNKTYEFRNMILNNYIRKFIERSIDITKVDNNLKFRWILIKLDTPIQGVNYNSNITGDSFDFAIEIYNNEYKQELNTTNTSLTYYVIVHQNERVIGLPLPYIRNLSHYNGRKICNIAFTTEEVDPRSGTQTCKVEAILDVSNYNIYIQKNEDISITRKDIITTDGAFKTNNKSKVPAPAHLAPILLDNIIYDESLSVQKRCGGLLYSISTSNDGKLVEQEYIIGTDVNVNVVGNSIEFSIIPNNKNDYVSYLGDTYLSYSYLGKPTYKYMILKYKIMQLVDSTATDTGYYYTLTVPINKIGNLKFKINYERGE